MGLAGLGRVSVDGTKVRANASKRKAMSYGRMGEAERRLRAEIAELLEKAEAVDAEEDARNSGSPTVAGKLPGLCHIGLGHRSGRREALRARVDEYDRNGPAPWGKAKNAESTVQNHVLPRRGPSLDPSSRVGGRPLAPGIRVAPPDLLRGRRILETRRGPGDAWLRRHADGSATG